MNSLEKLKKIDQIARSINGYYTRFGLPLDSKERMEKHKKEIDKMLKIIEK